MLLDTMWVPLMLLTALPDTSSACPLLIVQQPDPVELGEDVLMNCTTSHDGYRSIYWSYGNGTKVDEFSSYVELSIPHSDLDTKAKCTIKLNDTAQCSKDIRLNVYKVVQINETAQENKPHEFKCDVPEVPENLTVTWYMKSENMKTRVHNKSAKTNVDSLLVKNVSREDNGTTITCEIRMDLEQGYVFVSNKTWNLSVQNAETFDTNLNNSDAVSSQTEAPGNETKETVTPAPETSSCPVTITPSKLIVQNNKPASANCSTTEDHDGMGWEATIGGKSLTQNVTSLEWKVEKVDWSISADCFINLLNGFQCKVALDIIVYNFTEKIQVSPVGSDQLIEGEPHELKCEFSNVAPLEKLKVKWYLEDELIHPEFHPKIALPLNGSEIFTLTPKKEHNKANFKCEIELLLVQDPKEGQNPKVVSAPFTANVLYKPSIQDCPANYAGKEDELKLDTVPCKANGNPQPVIYWYYKDKPVNSSKALTRNDSGTYTGIFENNIGNISTTVTVTIEYGPLFTCKDLYNVTENAQIGSPCEPEGLPKPKSVWFKDEKQMDVPKVWKRHDSGQYLIRSSNKHGQANHTLSVNVLYAPSLSEDITQEFHMGENLTLNCSADGNPLPQLHWKYPQAAVENRITRGRQIYITEATSTNAGDYICSATNEIGSVSRTVTLIMKGTTHINYYVIIIFVILALLLGIFVSVLIYRNYKKKSGHYDVIAMSDSVPLTSR